MLPGKLATLCSLLASAMLSLPATAQTFQKPAPGNDKPASAMLATDPWEIGAFFQGGVGIGSDRSDFRFTSAGVRVGKVITDQHLRGPLRGQFEYAGELMPYWQAFTPAPHTQVITTTNNGTTEYTYAPVGGGTYSGLSITPIILRWNLQTTARFAPWIQGAGGLIWTNHKFPPDFMVQQGQPGGTSVFNFTPQFGVGFHYFIKDRRSIDFAANAIHISSASLGDHNPGVNASVQFQIGYTWWK